MAYGETYEEFVEKFKPKKTTDDCYTPPLIYEAVKGWAIKEYNWENREIVRPFWPGGDYKNYKYTKDCVVIDNPPFSTISEIAKFYEGRKIDYFLFAPSKTLLSIRVAKSHIGVGCGITYENGAVVDTSFISSCGPTLRSAPELYKIVRDVEKELKGAKRPKYKYPDNIIMFSKLEAFSKNGIDYFEDNAYFIRQLDAQKPYKKEIYGAGYIVPENKVLESKKMITDKMITDETIVWELSEREKEIADSLK